MTLALKEAGLIKMEIFFQDGTKIRADASKSSFKKKEELESELAGHLPITLFKKQLIDITSL